MSILGSMARQLSDRVLQTGPVALVREALYERRFRRSRGWHGLHRGLYSSFDEARRSAPPTLPQGYVIDDEGWVELTLTRVGYYDYPVLFWLRPLLAEIGVVFDLGGHVGVHRMGYARYLDFPAGLRWLVCEQPHVVELGRKLTGEGRVRGVDFTTDPADGDGADVLLSQGAIQVMERPIWELVGGWRDRPRHLFLNKVPLYDRETRVTLQNTGASFAPRWMWNRGEFLGAFGALGYQLVDDWACPDRKVRLPFHEEHEVERFSGLYLRRG